VKQPIQREIQSTISTVKRLLQTRASILITIGPLRERAWKLYSPDTDTYLHGRDRAEIVIDPKQEGITVTFNLEDLEDALTLKQERLCAQKT